MFYAFFQNIWQPVYPCVYREHCIPKLPPKSMTGLSLCIQGTCVKSIAPRHAARFIPVYTGNIV